MTPLAVELLRILTAEADHSPLKAESPARVLAILGWSPEPVPLPEIEAALSDLIRSGRVERVMRRHESHYRVQRHDRGDMSAPESAA
jgi:hypothetical protein